MAEALVWWFCVELLGVIAFPIAFSLFNNLPDKGYAFSKVLGILILGYFLWLGATFRLFPNARGSIILILSILILVSLLVVGRCREEIGSFLRRSRHTILATEGLFSLSFLLWVVIRAYNPEISTTEQPMDFAFLNAILRSEYFPPHDPWLSGHPISYYYFGYLIMAVLTKLSSVPSAISYNLSLALLFALTTTGAFGILFNLVALANPGNGEARKEASIWKLSIGFGLVGALLLVGLGNLEGVLEMLRAHGFGVAGFWQWIGIRDLAGPYHSLKWYPTDPWWWWRATRVIGTTIDGRSLDYTIEEFPFFSFLLGDLHPHVMALPFALLALAFSLNIFNSKDSLGLSWIRRKPLHFGTIALSLGAMGFLNSWDLPTYAFIFVSAVLIQKYLQESGGGRRLWGDLATFAGVLMIVAILLYLPFYLGFRSQASGILPVRGVGTRPLYYAIYWGLFLFVSNSFLLLSGARVLKRPIPWHRVGGAILAVISPLALWAIVELAISTATGGVQKGLLAIGQKTWQLLPLLVILSFALFVVVAMTKAVNQDERQRKRSVLFVSMLVLIGFLLTMLTELFYIRDVFGNRMNTVFKLYYQAWVLLAIASSFGIYYLDWGWRAGSFSGKVTRSAWLCFCTLLLAASLIYPTAALFSKTNAFVGRPTLDGTAFVERGNPAEWEAIQWLNHNVEGAPVIVEAVGGEYSEYGRVSERTGLPTILGWAGHELQWRGSDRDFRGRDGDVASIYQSADISQTLSLLKKYDATYVYVGHLERAKYGPQSAEKLAQFMEVAFKNEGVTIYKLSSLLQN